MSKKLDKVSNSIKSKLSFDDYKPSTPNDVKTAENNAVKPERQNKTKVTFYLQDNLLKEFNEFYAKRLIENHKLAKSDVISQAIKNLIVDPEIPIESF